MATTTIGAYPFGSVLVIGVGQDMHFPLADSSKTQDVGTIRQNLHRSPPSIEAAKWPWGPRIHYDRPSLQRCWALRIRHLDLSGIIWVRSLGFRSPNSLSPDLGNGLWLHRWRTCDILLVGSLCLLHQHRFSTVLGRGFSLRSRVPLSIPCHQCLVLCYKGHV
ncbi:hypothetical protein GUJ93_ZPchr0009g925 [Zizania palustris]|uniref:Uncharacterized protein n=1 Tax=Zizania palustris TaxID=103762 RepID=A0A8J5R169_ZIZPA|nr:hypothetical protein GUJ93_ZPchr0009g925 [Zizania palustris]